MAQLAFENEAPTNARWVVDSREALRGGPSYTIDTLVELHREYSASTRSDHSEHRATQSAPTVPGFKLFLVLGRDQYNRLEHWHRSADLRRYAIICVAERGRGCWTNAENHHLSQSINTPDVHIDLPAMSTSATAIREAVQRASPIDGLVKSSVARYIASNNLYAPLNRAPL